MRLRLVALILGLGLASAATAAAENGADFQLDWQATPSCSSAAQLREAVVRDLHGAPAGAVPVRAQARAEQSANGAWHVELVTEVQGQAHHRSFDAESCAAAEAALALILAFAINPQATPEGSDGSALSPLDAAAGTASPQLPTPSAGPTQSPPVGPTQSSPRSAEPQQATAPAGIEPARAPLAAVSGALVFDLGTLPALTEGAELSVSLTPEHFRFELAFAPWLARDATAEDSATRARFRLSSAAVRAGYAWPLGQVSVGALLALDLAHLSGQGLNGSAGNSQTSDWLGGASAAGVLGWAVGDPVELHLALEAVHWFDRPKFVVTEPSSVNSRVYQPSGAVGRALIGASVHFF